MDRLGWVRVILAVVSLVSTATNAQGLNNVILIIADDLSPFYLDPHHPSKMPNIQDLAKRGTHFTNAYSTFPVCGPSRMSILTGRYADTTNLFTFERFVPQVPGLTSIAQYLANNHGYETAAFGKAFHEETYPSDPRAMGFFEAGLWTDRQFGGGSADNDCSMQWYCNIPTQQTGDFKLSRTFVSYLAKRNASRPLFTVLGLRKPHLDVGVPTEFSSPDNVKGRDVLQTNEPASLGAGNEIIPFRQSLQRFECYWEIAARKIGRYAAFPPEKLFGSRLWPKLQQIRRFYFGATAFCDSLVGYVLRYIQGSPTYANNTAVVFISDHGFANGEHGMFCKNALFEQQSRVAMVVAPAMRDKSADRGRVRSDPVDLVNVFPTVVHLATGLELPWRATIDASGMPLDGRSLLQPQRSVLSVYAFSQYPRCDTISRKANWQCIISRTACGRIPNIFMGYTVRTATKRYVEWRKFRDVILSCDRPDWPGLTDAVRQRMGRVNQINTTATGTIWNEVPVQRELFDDYNDMPGFQWGKWELSNALVQRLGNQTDVISALEMSSAIRWRFDASFAGNRTQPCSGNGYVRMKDPSKWINFDIQPNRTDLVCECLNGWIGNECQTAKSP